MKHNRRKKKALVKPKCNKAITRSIFINREYFSKNYSQTTSNIIEYSSTQVHKSVFTNDRETIYKHNLYWSNDVFSSSWKDMIKPCLNNMKNRRKINRRNVTRIEKSDIIFEKNVDDTVLYIKIYSKNQDEEYKRVGGDWWKLEIIYDDISFTADMQDKNDGTYFTFISVLADGYYKIVITIFQSLCEGFMDPPEDFFKKGNTHYIF